MTQRVGVATRLMLREQARRPLLVVLLILLPFFFITRAIAATDPDPRAIGLPGGEQLLTDMQQLHGASMVMITIAFLAGLCGAFIMRSARASDQRLVVAGFRPGEVIRPRLAVLAAATLLATVVSLAVTALSFTPASWPWFVLGNLLVGLLYASLGALAGAMLGQLGATYSILFLAMLGMGILQNPMFGAGTPSGAAVWMPDYGAARVVIDGGFGTGFHAFEPLALAAGWSLLLGSAVLVVLRRSLTPTLTLKGPTMKRPLTLLLVALAVGVFAAVMIGCGDDEATTKKPPATAADATFARDMIPHHEGAIKMAKLAKSRAEHPEIRQLADAIVSAQQSEITTLERISKQIGAAGGHSMSDNEMGMGGDPGALRSAKPFDRAFLAMMIPHHESAIRMAKAQLKAGKHPQLREISRAVIKAQTAEIKQMRAWMKEWYGKSVESDHTMDGM